MLQNVAGEFEREARSRRANLVEALVVMFILLATLWCLAYPLGVLMSLPEARTASRILIAALFCFVLLLSPLLHRDSLSSRGLGSPLMLLRGLRRRTLPKRLGVAGSILAAAAVLTFELYRNAAGTTRFVFAIEPAVTFHLQQTLGGRWVLLLACAALSLFWVTCIIRYDNFWPALKAALGVLAVLLPFTLLVAWAANGEAAFTRARPLNLLRDCLGYIFWGAVQQLVFSSYFGTRLRKSFAPAYQPRTWAWKRLGVALLNGSFFGLVHINSWLLVGFTSVLGTFISWLFMQDRYRNLQALGLVHGVLGTCIMWLFSRQQDALSIRLRVGPWAMPHRPDWVTLSVVGALLLALCLTLLLLSQSHRFARQRL